MIGSLIRLVVVVVILAAAAAFFMGYRIADRDDGVSVERPVATTGSAPEVDTTKARQTGAAIGERVATGANEAQKAIANVSLTGKIKSKMALDDTIEASRINVDTADGVVTLTGTLRTEAQRTRAVQLARETEGVKSVTDRLVVR